MTLIKELFEIPEHVQRGDFVLRLPPVKTAIHAIADLLLGAAPDQDGLCVLPGTEVISVCEDGGGAKIRQDNPFVDWIAGK